jgi:hypothetical protein
MKKDELLTVFGTHDIRTLPECIMSLLFGDQEVRDDVFRELIRCHAGDLSYDWFQEVYEEELSERRKKGQDFTPREVSMLETQLTGAREFTRCAIAVVSRWCDNVLTGRYSSVESVGSKLDCLERIYKNR